MIFGMTYYDILMNFLIYSLLGWITEVTFHAVALGKVINRGFLNGPVCPVYGFGVIVIFAVMNYLPVNTTSMEETPVWIIFLAGTILASLVELIAGWLLKHCFHLSWWDYSDKPFNLAGYICLEFSLIWGIGTVLIVRVLHPIISTSVDSFIPEKVGWIVMAVLYVFYFADTVVTILTIIGLNRKLKELNQIRSSMRVISDAMTEKIAESSITTSQKIEEGKVQAALARAELKDELLAAKEKAVNTAYSAREKAANTASSAKNVAVSTASSAKNAAVSTASSAKSVAVSTASSAKNVAASTASSAKDRAQELKSSVLSHTFFGAGRLLKAFPSMKHSHFAEELKELQESLKK